jgi:hypothetical protein
MPTPDEIYTKTLQEELDAGASQPVAKARANAARARAQQGGPASPEAAPKDEQETTASDASTSQPAASASGREATGDTGSEGRPAALATSEEPAPVVTPGNGHNGGDVAERVQRLLKVVRPDALKKVERAPLDRVSVWPHLMAAEAVAMMIVLALLVFFSASVDAPLRTLANFNSTPNPSKAPWYFLGLQELLRYFHPEVAGVTLPFIDRNPSTHPDDRKFAIVMFSFFVLTFAVLVTVGMFFRGPGFNFVFPWKGGIFFEL